ncbi:protein kinase [uncultured Pedobacter sp.]|uniref:protein kinase domain-containing protein n=1 Tax=uncultured Pedobacter sp. TaxID=246139 RepID=UPI0025FF8873|nr:protein kinase [uncultured Pedobacter sp.]
MIRKIGNGGNGIVYEVDLNGNRFAMKTLIDFSRTTRYARFRDEVQALSEIGPINNVINLLDSSLPEAPKKADIPFYTMPLGEPYLKYINAKPHNLLFADFLKIVKAVAELHSKGYTHRDIKPDNLLYIKGEPVLSDFGLVSFPDKSSKSQQNEKIGPQWTIAPEMKRTSSTAEFKKADVYSLAKTLSILVTGSKFGFEGQYVPNSNISIDKFVEVMINKSTLAGEWYYHSTVILDNLLRETTDNDPDKRPSAKGFYEILKFWFETNDEFESRNPYEWRDALETIFPHGTPATCEWTSVPQIFSVMKRMVAYDNLNYFFYPERGGDMMRKIEISPNRRALIINGDMLITPEKLIFRSSENQNVTYFRLVVQPVQHHTVEGEGEIREEYIADAAYNFLAEIDAGVEGREIEQYLRGSFIFVNKRSRINALNGMYRNGLFLDGHGGVHDKIPHDEYHQMLVVNC